MIKSNVFGIHIKNVISQYDLVTFTYSKKYLVLMR